MGHCAKRLLCFLYATAAAAPAGHAQETGAPAKPALQEIMVIGSHLPAAAEDAAVPVTTATRGELLLQGSPSLIDMLLDVPFVQGADGEADRFQGGGGTGVGADRATINIRGFGPSRSLVLVNERRVTWSPMATGQDTQMLVDINTLPAIALERVDFLRDGAAATYGSDAIAGVMNLTTRSGFTGIELSAGHKLIDGSGGDTELGLIGGLELGAGRGRVVSSLGVVRRRELELHHREWALLSFAENPRGGWSSTGRPATFIPGATRDVNASGVIDPNCAALGGHPTRGNRRCRFQYTPFDNLVEAARRRQWFTEGSWEVGESWNVSGEFLRSSSEVPDWNTSPSYPPNFVIDPQRALRANNPALVDMAIKHPDLYGAYAFCGDKTRCGWPGGAWDPVGWVLGRSFGQAGPLRGESLSSSTSRWVAALDGEAGGLRLSGSAAYSRSERELTQADTMVYRDRRAVQGLGGLACEQQVPNEYGADGRLAFSLATLKAHAGKGDCLYWSPFSNGMHGAHPQVRLATAYQNPDFNPALDNRRLIDYLLTERSMEGETSLLVLEGMARGELPRPALAGGGIGFALGIQWRRETYQFGPPPGALNDGAANPCPAGPGITNCGPAGQTGLFGFLPPNYRVAADRGVRSVMGELRTPFSDSLDARWSLRYESYGGKTGSSLDPKLAIRWRLSEPLTLRASAGTTFRGPTLNQTVSGNASNSLQYVAATGAFKSLITRGDPQLDPEEAFTFNIGGLLHGGGLLAEGDGFNASIDYWSYRFSGPLVVEPFDRVLAAACPQSRCDASNPYYGRILFGGDATLANIQAIEVRVVNGPDINTDGIDFSAGYRLPAGEGVLEMTLAGTRILSYAISAWALNDAYDALGRLNYRTSLARTLTEWKLRWQVNYAWRNLNLRYAARYINSYENVPDSIRVASDLTHDLHLQWVFRQERVSLWGSVLNIADRDPPFAGEDLNYDAFTHKPLGRVFKLGFRYRR